MMSGKVNHRQAGLPVTIQLLSQPGLTLEFVVNTGFTGELTLPQAAVAVMQLPFLYDQRSVLADGSTIFIPVHQAIIFWNGTRHLVRVLATGRRPLLGTALLDDQELRVRFREGDFVSVEDL